MEYCGNVVPPNPFIVGAGIFILMLANSTIITIIIHVALATVGMFTLKFRSSFFDSYPGFQIFITCLSSAGILCQVSALKIQNYVVFLCQSPNKMQNLFAMNQNLV